MGQARDTTGRKGKSRRTSKSFPHFQPRHYQPWLSVVKAWRHAACCGHDDRVMLQPSSASELTTTIHYKGKDVASIHA